MLGFRKRTSIGVLVIVCILISFTTILAYKWRPSQFKKAIKNDIARYKGIVHRVQSRTTQLPHKTRKATEEPLVQETQDEEDPPIGERQVLKRIIEGSVKLPMYAAADYGIGLYFVDIEFGTPPQKLRMVVDTGSDLTWFKCNNGSNGRGFEPARSETYREITCSSKTCSNELVSLASLKDCPNINAPCLYNYSYGIEEGTETYGVFAEETAALPTTKNTTIPIDKFLIGCSETYQGKDVLKASDGILGLGMNPYSFSLHAATLVGGTFQYCLVDHLSHNNRSSYLVFGDQREKAPMFAYMRYTALRMNILNPYFWVNVKGISVGPNMLDIPPMVWFYENGGTILDSGTALTYWADPAYRAIMDALIEALVKVHPKMPDSKGDGSTGFEYCFNTSTKPFDPTSMPKLQIHFTDGTRFKPHIKSYIIDDGPDVKCIGFLEALGGMHIIGNIMQQNYLWEFDLQHSMVGFSPSTCS